MTLSSLTPLFRNKTNRNCTECRLGVRQARDGVPNSKSTSQTRNSFGAAGGGCAFFCPKTKTLLLCTRNSIGFRSQHRAHQNKKGFRFSSYEPFNPQCLSFRLEKERFSFSPSCSPKKNGFRSDLPAHNHCQTRMVVCFTHRSTQIRRVFVFRVLAGKCGPVTKSCSFAAVSLVHTFPQRSNS